MHARLLHLKTCLLAVILHMYGAGAIAQQTIRLKVMYLVGISSTEIWGYGVLAIDPDSKIDGYITWTLGEIDPEHAPYLEKSRHTAVREKVKGTYSPNNKRLYVSGVSIEQQPEGQDGSVGTYELELRDNNTVIGSKKGEGEEREEKLAGGYSTGSDTGFLQYNTMQDWRNEAKGTKVDREAILYYTLAIHADTTCELCYYGRGLGYDKLFGLQQAASDYTRAISFNPLRPYYFLKRSRALSTLAKHEESVNDISTALEIGFKDERNTSLAYYQRGWNYHELKKYKEAIADYTRSIQLDSANIVGCYYFRGYCHAELKEYDLALKDYNNILAIDPSDKQAKEAIAALNAKR